MNDVNLALFQYDYDVTWMCFFLNADEGVYSRYGGRDEEGAESRISIEGLKITMRRVLETHSNRPEQAIPALRQSKNAAALYGAKGGGCIHCHHVWEGLRKQAKKEGRLTDDLIHVYPLPENIGVKVDVHQGNRVVEVLAGSPARKLGLQKTDLLTRVNQVNILAQGDIMYALHRAPKQGTIELEWLRDQTSMRGSLELPAAWRMTDRSWRASVRREEEKKKKQ